jgi:hypothetical protein
LLASEERIIPTLVDSLLLDPEHPRIDNTALQGVTDWESAKGPVQQVSRRSSVSLAVCLRPYLPLCLFYLCVYASSISVRLCGLSFPSCVFVQDIAEAIAQLAMFPRGREALLQDPSMADALRQVAAEGWTQEARLSAEAALLAMSDRQPDADHDDHAHDQKHIMLSCE